MYYRQSDKVKQQHHRGKKKLYQKIKHCTNIMKETSSKDNLVTVFKKLL